MSPTFALHTNVAKENTPSMKGSTSTGRNTSSNPSSSDSNNSMESSQSKKRKSLLQRLSTAKTPERVAFSTLQEGGKSTSTKTEGSSDVLEVWFAGCHAGQCSFRILLLAHALTARSLSLPRRRWGVCPKRRTLLPIQYHIAMDGSSGRFCRVCSL